MGETYVIGIDFGSDSVRAILVETETARTLHIAVEEYPRWKEKRFCDEKNSQYRQHPLDYLECMEKVLKTLLRKDPAVLPYIVGIAVDTTGSTVCPVNKEGIPLSMTDMFAEDPDAMFHLWKDHTAILEAEQIDRVLSSGEVDYTKYQGKYSAEWFWAKILHTIRKNKRVRESAYCWVEHVDWITGVLAGNVRPDTIVHCSCAAGHKALWNSEFYGLPNRELLASMDPYLGMIYDRYQQKPKCAGEKVGTLCKEWAQKLGISQEVVIGVGSFDAHAGAVGIGIKEKTMVKVVGTSTVDMMIVRPQVLKDKDTKAFCGLAEDSIIPGYMGAEAGQSAFGDTYAWMKKMLMWSLEHIEFPQEVLSEDTRSKILQYLERHLLKELEKEICDLAEDGLIATDWFNGRRYPYLDENAKGTITGLTLGTTASGVYRALVQATVFGSRRIYDSLRRLGIEIEQVICVGGIAQKSEYIMQMMSDALNVPIAVSQEEQSCARGAAIYAAVAAGIFPTISKAQENLCEKIECGYYPNEERHRKLEEKFKAYRYLGEFVACTTICH